MKALIAGVYNYDGRNTSCGHIRAFESQGWEAVRYDFRKDRGIIDIVKSSNFDLVVILKGEPEISASICSELKKYTKVCLWFMDPIKTLQSSSHGKSMHNKIATVDFFCCDKENILPIALKLNKNSFYVPDGYDIGIDKPWNLEKEYDVSFIGLMNRNHPDFILRHTMINAIKQVGIDVKLIQNKYLHEHAKEVSKSKINLNFCTSFGASHRVKKIMASGGFLISDDWINRDKYLVDGKDIVIFNDEKDLQDKARYYLAHNDERITIAENGYNAIKKFSRDNWAAELIKVYENVCK